MTNVDLRSELEKHPFLPIRLHLVIGKVVEVTVPDAAWVLKNAVMVFQDQRPGQMRASRYDMIALRNIERIEQFSGRE